MINSDLIFYLSLILGIIIMLSIISKKIFKIKYWIGFYIILCLFSICIITYGAIMFVSGITYILVFIIHWSLISYYSHELLTKFYSKKVNEKLLKIKLLVIITCYIIIIYFIKNIFIIVFV